MGMSTSGVSRSSESWMLISGYSGDGMRRKMSSRKNTAERSAKVSVKSGSRFMSILPGNEKKLPGQRRKPYLHWLDDDRWLVYMYRQITISTIIVTIGLHFND